MKKDLSEKVQYITLSNLKMFVLKHEHIDLSAAI